MLRCFAHVALLPVLTVCPLLDAGSITYRVMSYNVGSAAHIPLGPRQIDQIADTIVDNAADVVGLCEVDVGTAWHGGRDHTAELLVALAARGWPMHIHRWPTVDALGGWQVNALLTRLPIQDMGYEQMHPPGQPAWQVGYVTLQVSPSTQIRAYMTHIWPASQHPETIGSMGAWANAWDGPATVMGDFNHGWQSPQAEAFRAAGWQSSCEVVHGKVCPTVQGSAYISGPLPLNGQIDFVYGNDHIAFVDSYVGYFSMSDHWPVVAVVRVETPDEPFALALPYEPGARSSSSGEAAVDPHRRLRNTAFACYRDHEYGQAAEAFSLLEARCTDADEAGFIAYSSACMLLLHENDAQARSQFEHVTRSYPDTEWMTRSFYQLAFLHRSRQLWQEAEEAFVRYIHGYYEHIHPSPRSPALQLVASELEHMWNQAGQKKSAKSFLDAWSTDPPSPMIARSLAFHRGRTLLTAGNRDQAYQAFTQALPLADWVYREDARDLAMLFLEHGDRADAEAFHAQYRRCASDERIRRVRDRRWKKMVEPDSCIFTVRSMNDVTIDGRLAETTTNRVQRLEGPEHVFRYDPYGPYDALTATLYLGVDDAFLYVGMAVEDSIHDSTHSAESMWLGDSLQIAVDPEADATVAFDDDDFELGVGLIGGQVVTHVWADRKARDFDGVQAAVVHADGRTVYEVALPRELFTSASEGWPERIGFNVLVNDADGHGRIGWLDWSPGIAEEKRPELYSSIQFGLHDR